MESVARLRDDSLGSCWTTFAGRAEAEVAGDPEPGSLSNLAASDGHVRWSPKCSPYCRTGSLTQAVTVSFASRFSHSKERSCSANLRSSHG